MTMQVQTQKKPHIHSEMIKAWAEGSTIQVWANDWYDITNPPWILSDKYRVKPEPKPDSIITGRATVHKHDGDDIGRFGTFSEYSHHSDNLKLTFDGETGKLKAAEVINK